MNFNPFQSDLLNSGAATVEEAPKAQRPNVKRVSEITEDMLKVLRVFILRHWKPTIMWQM